MHILKYINKTLISVIQMNHQNIMPSEKQVMGQSKVHDFVYILSKLEKIHGSGSRQGLLRAKDGFV